MTAADIVHGLGRYNVIVRTRHHLQIPVGKKKYHDIWVSSSGDVRMRMHGDSRANVFGLDEIHRRLAGYKYEATEQSAMEVAALLRRSGGRIGVFVDAGFKEGRARIAVVKHDEDGGLEIRARNIVVNTVNQAEEAAVEWAKSLWPTARIYCDNKPVAIKTGVSWISRDGNGVADSVANLRKPDASQCLSTLQQGS